MSERDSEGQFKIYRLHLPECPLNKSSLPPPFPEPEEEGAENVLRDALANALEVNKELQEKLNKIQEIARS